MESSIKDSYHGGIRHKSLASVDTCDVSRVVQRSKFYELCNTCESLIVNQSGRGECLAAVYYAVTYCLDVVHIADDAMILICQSVKNETDSNFMILHGLLDNYFVFTRRSMSQDRTFNTNFFYQTFCFYKLLIHINKLIFERRAACVYY